MSSLGECTLQTLVATQSLERAPSEWILGARELDFLEDDVHYGHVMIKDLIVWMTRWVRMGNGIENAKAEAAFPSELSFCNVYFRHFEPHPAIREFPWTPVAVDDEADEDPFLLQSGADPFQVLIAFTIVIDGDKDCALVDD